MCLRCRIRGVEVLKKLFHLNLANNLIRDVDPVLGRCKQLHVLDLSTNRIESIQQMPRLTSLVILHLNDNKVTCMALASTSLLIETYFPGKECCVHVPFVLSTKFESAKYEHCLCVLNYY